MAQIIPLSEVTEDLIERLLDEAFGAGRRARTAYRIREGVQWLEGPSLAAVDDKGFLLGTIQVWPVALTDERGRAHPLLMVGPVAVLPAHQNEGIGKALMIAALDAIDRAAAPASALPQVMIGDPAYYSRFFGFDSAPTRGWQCPGPVERDRLLVRCANPAVLPREGMLGPWKKPPKR